MLTIGKLASSTGITRDAIRFYERLGLLSAASRTDRGYRLYDEADVHRIDLIRQGQRCGLTLEAIRELLEPVEGDRPCASRAYRAAAAQIEPLDRKLEALSAMRRRLADFIRRCERGGERLAGFDIVSMERAAAPATAPQPGAPSEGVIAFPGAAGRGGRLM